jgi:hypothetical protein
LHFLRLRSPQRVDYACAALIFVIAGTIAAIFLRDVGVTFFYQTLMSATVMAGCGRGFAQPAIIPPSLLDFLTLKSTVFDCSQLADVAELGTAGPFANTHLHLAAAVAYLWRLLGVNYQSLWPLLAALHGAYATACFLLGRLFFGRIIAVMIGLLVALSPIAISMLFLLRDFSKAPFVILTVVMLVWGVRQSKPRNVLLSSLATGFLIAIGVGFRRDVMILLPVAVIIFAFGVNKGIAASTRAAAIMFLMTAALATPRVWTTDYIVKGAGFYYLAGATEPFRNYLGLTPAAYNLGWFSDELILSSIAADLRRANPAAYDAGESKPLQGVTQALSRSSTYLLQWLPLFGADVATRALKSAVLITGFPALLAADRRAIDPSPVSYPLTPIARVTAKFISFTESRWISVVGILGLVAFLFRIYSRAPREAASVAAILIVLLTYPSAQFSLRHFFHLEVFFWIGIASLAMIPFDFPKLRACASGFSLWLIGFLICGAISYTALVMIQDHMLKRETMALLMSPSQSIATTVMDWPDNRSLFRVPVPSQYEPLVRSAPDSLHLPSIRTISPFEVRAAADRLAIVLGGPDCAAGPIAIDIVYDKTTWTWQPLDRGLSIQIGEQGTGDTVMIIPAIYRPTQSFAGVAVPRKRSGCVRAVNRIEDAKRLPTIFSAVLGPSWMNEPFFQSLGKF